MRFLSSLATNKLAWQLLALSALAFELSALFFQYGLKLEPCIMCIYQRVAIWGVFLAGIVGIWGYQHIIFRLLGYISWGVGSIWGLMLAIEHHDIQTSPMSFMFSCEFTPNFPSWLPLHEWLPFLFDATGDCGDIDWQFLGYSMPQVMMLIFAVYALALFAVLISRLTIKKSI